MMTDAERDLQRFEDILKEIGLIRESLNGLDRDAVAAYPWPVP